MQSPGQREGMKSTQPASQLPASHAGPPHRREVKARDREVRLQICPSSEAGSQQHLYQESFPGIFQCLQDPENPKPRSIICCRNLLLVSSIISSLELTQQRVTEQGCKFQQAKGLGGKATPTACTNIPWLFPASER